jgi:hypothetical protein
VGGGGDALLVQNILTQGGDDDFLSPLQGCPSLLDAVKDRVKPMVHVFGHAHLQYGRKKLSVKEVACSTTASTHNDFPWITFLNVATLGRGEVVNPPVTFDFQSTFKEPEGDVVCLWFGLVCFKLINCSCFDRSTACRDCFTGGQGNGGYWLICQIDPRRGWDLCGGGVPPSLR